MTGGIGPASTFAAPGDFWGCPCRPVTARSTYCGIDDFVLRGDLRDRSVFLHLPAIPETRRQTERKFWPAFRADYPRILGGVLDAIVGGLRELPSVNLTDLPRMADYAEWGEAISRGLGWGADTFISILIGEAATASSPRKRKAPSRTDRQPIS